MQIAVEKISVTGLDIHKKNTNLEEFAKEGSKRLSMGAAASCTKQNNDCMKKYIWVDCQRPLGLEATSFE